MILRTVRPRDSFNVDIMMINICGRYYAKKLKFSSYVNLPSINKIFQYVMLE